MKLQKRITALLLCAASPFVHAEGDNTPLDLNIVTGTRSEQPLSQSLSSVTVLTQEDIQNSQAQDVPTILRDVAGVEIAQNGGMGTPASMFMRGANSNQVLVLVDGVRMNSATAGGAAIQDIMLDQIERIEVVRGNVSSLYGPDAVGGVVQIFTKQGHGVPHMNYSAGVGSLGTFKTGLGYGGMSGDTDFNVQVSRNGTSGLPDTNPAIAPTQVNPSNDGYDNTSLSLNVRHAVNADHTLMASAFDSQSFNAYNSAYRPDGSNGLSSDTNFSTEHLSKFSLASEDKLSSTWDSHLQLAESVDDNQNYLNGATYSGSYLQTTQDQLSWQNTLRLSTGKLLLGTEYLGQRADTNAYGQIQRTVNSAFAGYTGIFGAHEVQFNLRDDHNSEYGSPLTGLVGYGYTLSSAWRVAGSLSTAFRAPTFNDLYYSPGNNPALLPEHSKNIEAGVHYLAGGQKLDVVYFDNHIRDLIQFSGNNSVNVGLARINGVETEYTGQFGSTEVKGSMTAQDPRNANTQALLLRRSIFHSSAGVTQQMGIWRVGGEWVHSGIREDLDQISYGLVNLPAYDDLNFTASRALDRDWKFSVRLSNLLNQNDATVSGYNPLGRTIFATISYR